GYVRQGVQILNLRSVGVVHYTAVLAIRQPENLVQRLAVSVLGDGVVELLPADDVDDAVLLQRFFWQDADVRAYERNLDVRIGVLDRFGEADVAGESGRTGEQDQQLVVFAGLDGLFRRHMVGRGVQQACAGQHPRGISEPDGIPVRFDFARGRPARSRAA